ncbi:YvaD family protein [Paenibacillus sp. P26]|nr:YvaD family protein [Paenibacillus sp. P26]UUZ93716.1 YvaD family protein [Paenibacillus sp. P25]
MEARGHVEESKLWLNSLRTLIWITDIGFILYWTVTALKLIPPEYLYNDYTNPLLVSWNWSFMPLDLLISLTGLYSLSLHKQGRPVWAGWSLISLMLTFVSGLMAISFWSVRGEFDPLWWIPNLYLLLYPLLFIPRLIRLYAK